MQDEAYDYWKTQSPWEEEALEAEREKQRAAREARALYLAECGDSNFDEPFDYY